MVERKGVLEKIKKWTRKEIVIPASRFYANIWNRYYFFRYKLQIFRIKYDTFLAGSFIPVLIVPTLYYTPLLQRVFEPYFTQGTRLSDLKIVLITIGGALIGAAAISFSLVMFAMQINIERMPHGLFGKFSSDKKVIVAFTVIFFLATGIASLSLFVEVENIAISILGGLWSLFLIISLVIYAYGRTLALINPMKQMTRIKEDTQKELTIWAKAANRAKPLLIPQAEETEQDQGSLFESSHDTALVAYYRLYPNWTQGSKNAVAYATSFARRYTAYGDYTVAGHALNVIVEINALYIKAKGRTFFADSALMINPLSTDGFINDTLEQLRQTLSIGFSRKDEQQIEQVLQTFTNLGILYSDIDYSREMSQKPHAALAVSYLSNGVQSALEQGYIDIVMQGLRWMGTAGGVLLEKAGTNSITNVVKDIGLISCAGIGSQKTRPVTVTGVEQLGNLSVKLLLSESHNVKFAAENIRSIVSMIAKILCQLPESLFESPASFNMAPYYSATTIDSLHSKLTAITNALLEAAPSNEEAQRIFTNIENWADGIHETEKELLLLAIEKRSQFTFDMIYWIYHLTTLLLALSKAPSCPEYLRAIFESHALRLLYTFSWIKDDEETMCFVENKSMTERLFDMALEASRRECHKFARGAREELLRWAAKAGKYPNERGVLVESIYALALLALNGDSALEFDNLKTGIAKHLLEPTGIKQETRDQVAEDLMERAASPHRDRYSLSRIEIEMNHQDQEKLRGLLEEIARLFSPYAEDETARTTDFIL